MRISTYAEDTSRGLLESYVAAVLSFMLARAAWCAHALNTAFLLGHPRVPIVREKEQWQLYWKVEYVLCL